MKTEYHSVQLIASIAPAQAGTLPHPLAEIVLAEADSYINCKPLFNQQWELLADRKKETAPWQLIKALQKLHPHLIFSIVIVYPNDAAITYPPGPFAEV
jgi:hypothetical protein